MHTRAKVFFVLIMLLLLLPFMAMVLGNSASFTSEQLKVDSLPRLISDEGINFNFFSDCDTYVSEHIGFRSQLIEANTTVFTKMFHMSPEDDVILGYDGWLYYSKSLDDYYNIQSISDRGINNIAYSIKMLEEAVEANNSEFVITFAPNKSTLYPNHMPLNYIQSDNEGNLERIENALEINGVNYVSLKNMFCIDSEVYYRKKDSHWNYKGALMAYNALMAASTLDYDTYEDISFADSYEWTGDLSNMLYVSKVTYDSQLTPIRTFGYQYVSKQKNVEANHIETYNKDGDGSAIIYRDSFGNTLIPFFAENFKECSFSKITPYNMMDVINNNPDITIIELVERNIPNFAKAAPVMTAPEAELEEEGYIVSSTKPLYTSNFEITEAGTHIYGTVDESILGDSYKVYACIDDGNGNVKMYEAFPIYEQLLLDGEDENYPKDNGFSLYVPEENAMLINLVVATNGKNYIL